ncbi:unnamed protein product [Candidula unifasciata]|uniref:Uncharacterized protein n=1 Tax=Candidula unifasciata TaxID=100452 RepID=A0A8S3YR79_9EUPU|nr:unnamed protein product [Candidula unifasciata]
MMRNSSEGGLPRLFQIFHGEVASLQSYGAFIRIPGCRKQGLLHKSQMSNARVEDPSEMLAKGERVFCKVIAMEADGEKIALSMKVVSQTSGKDLDPENIQSNQDEKRRRQWNTQDRRKIDLGAELNTTCRRCGGHGHFAMDCYVSKGDNRYALIPDLRYSAGEERSYRTQERKEDKKKKQKSKRRTSSPEDSDSGVDQRKKPTRVTGGDRSNKRDKYRQSSDSGSSPEVNERGKRQDRWEGKDERSDRFGESSRGEKYGSKRKVAEPESGSDSEGQGYRKQTRNSQEFRQAEYRPRLRSGSREARKKDGNEREKLRNTKDEREGPRRNLNATGNRERERGSEHRGEVARKRSWSFSSDEEKVGEKRGGKVNKEKSHKRR